MSATTQRTAQAAPDARQLGIALSALTLAVALLVAVAFGQQAATQSSTAPAAAPAQVVHDHGWSTADQDAIQYTGIPYTPTRSIDGGNGSNGTRFAQ